MRLGRVEQWLGTDAKIGAAGRAGTLRGFFPTNLFTCVAYSNCI